MRHTLTLLLALTALGSPLSAQPNANSCADPYWQDSLRCKVFPGQAPQPPAAPPATPAALREYTRVDLTGDWGVRCLDGTRPVVYIDPAVGGPSNKWLFTMTGGGACAAHDGNGDGTLESGQECAFGYVTGDGHEMGTAGDPAMKNLGDGDLTTSQGIHKPDLALNPLFAGYNRVRIEKCGFDRHMGRSTRAGVTSAKPGGGTLTYTLYQHGQSIVELALDTLRGNAGAGQGFSYTSWRAAGNAVQTFNETLPPLEAAESVVFVGHSAAGHGLIFKIDSLAERLRGWPAFHGDVRGVVDAHFVPAPENEAAFDATPGGDAYTHQWAGTTPEAGTYDLQQYYTDPATREVEQANSWLPSSGAPLSSILDRSCVAAHPADSWKCRDRNHVLLNHLESPVFVREDFSDPNIEHTNGGTGYTAAWGEWGSYPSCPAYGQDPCPPVIRSGNPSPYRDRLSSQAATFLQQRATRSELALDLDPSGPAGQTPTLFLYLPDCGAHGGTYEDGQFLGSRIRKGATTATLREWIEAFVAAPRTGVSQGLVDGTEGAVSICAGSTTSCTPSDTTLCLDDGPSDRRFSSSVTFQTSQGGGLSGNGTPLSLSSLGVAQGGLFWFFDPSNPEMLLKVLNGCGVNGHYWVFYSAGTNVGFTVTVTDTKTGRTFVRTNSDLTAAPPVQVTTAFPCD